MTEPQDPAAPSDPPPGGAEPPPDVGSVGEEALKLLGALADLARQHGPDVGHGVAGLAGQAAALAQEVNHHVATDAAECRYCPICRVVHVARETSPEVKAHLLTAASSLLQAAAGVLETVAQPERSGSRRGPEVERIDLDDDGPDHPEDPS